MPDQISFHGGSLIQIITYRSQWWLCTYQTTSVAVLSSTSQELRLHGVEMQGPCEKLRRAGASGKWTSNIQRDMLRAASTGDDVSWWKPVRFGVSVIMIIML